MSTLVTTPSATFVGAVVRATAGSWFIMRVRARF
jgi:hypothetical protein